MRQAVKISFMGCCSPSATVPMAFHILLVRTAVYCHINMYSFLPEGVTVINALWGLAVTLDREARASCNQRGSPTLNWSLKDEGVGGGGVLAAVDLAEFKCFLLASCQSLCHCGRNPRTWKLGQGIVTFSRSKTRRDVCFSQTAHSRTTSVASCINKLQASTGKQTLLSEASTTGHHMCLLR